MREPVSGRLIARLRARRRLLVSIAAGLILFPILPERLAAETRLALAWDATASCYLTQIVAMSLRSRPDDMRRRAAQEDTSVAANLLIAVVAAGFSLLAVTTLLMMASGLQQPTRGLHLLLGGATTLLSWFVVHTLFAVHCAHAYYAPDTAHAGNIRGGLGFPSEEAPDYFDFLYFSFVIGMTAQVSDVAVKSREMRRTALVQGLVAFVFNTLVLAFAVNIAAGLI